MLNYEGTKWLLIPCFINMETCIQIYFNRQYIVTGSVSYTRPSSGGETTYYLQDEVTVTYKGSDGYTYTKSKSGYGYNAASVTVDELPNAPTKKTNTGYYRSGTSFILIDTK